MLIPPSLSFFIFFFFFSTLCACAGRIVKKKKKTAERTSFVGKRKHSYILEAKNGEIFTATRVFALRSETSSLFLIIIFFLVLFPCRDVRRGGGRRGKKKRVVCCLFTASTTSKQMRERESVFLLLCSDGCDGRGDFISFFFFVSWCFVSPAAECEESTHTHIQVC